MEQCGEKYAEWETIGEPEVRAVDSTPAISFLGRRDSEMGARRPSLSWGWADSPGTPYSANPPMDSTLAELRRRPQSATSRDASPTGVALADDKRTSGNPDRQRIDTSKAYELCDWAKKLGGDEDMIRTAVVQVGSMASDVERYLRDKAKR